MKGLPSPPQDHLQSLKARYVAAVRAASEIDAGSFLSKAVFVVMILAAATILLLPVTIFLFPRWRKLRTAFRFARDAVRFAERAQPVMGFPLMVNRILRAPGSVPAAGLVLVSFDPEKGASVEYMGRLTVLVGNGSAPELSAEDRAFCRSLMDDEVYVPFRRRRLPDSITGGTEVIACDLAIAPQLLPGGRVADEMPLLPCMAEPGEAGWISQIPHWVVARTDAADPEAEHAFGVTVLSLSGLAKIGAGQRPAHDEV